MPLSQEKPFAFEGTRHFAVADYLQEGKQIGKYRVTYIGPNFARHFASIVETDVPATAVKVHTVQAHSLDSAVHGALAMNPRQEPAMAQLFAILLAGETGPGLFNGFSNVIYKTSPLDGQLYTPHWYIRGDRIGFGALAFDHPDGWEPGDHIYTLT